ncbi:MAG TPA: heat-inducible transcriptional repressor HrcA [Bryobacteraceae bacterium]|nr:heat-inducible transcriptional repressor HrcA [Bryobacteraceae bacterium]
MVPRTRELLHEIVEAFIETGEPVASRAIAQRRGDTLSAASIRNVMADLDEAGFLCQPHTSAGRVPTEKAFRSYVQSLTLRRMAADELERLRTEISRLETIEQRVEFTSRALMGMTRGVGIAAAIPDSSPALEHIELVALPDRRILMVVVTRDHEVRNRVVTLDEMVSPDELVSIRNYVNRNFAGWTLEAVRRELSARLDKASAAYDEILRKLTLLYSKGLLDIDSQPEVHTEGASNLVGLDLHLTKEKMRELFRALEEKKRVLELVDRFLEQPAGELAVHLGLAMIHPAMRELSLIGLPVKLDGGISAVIAVLGPMRMNYGRVMSAVQQVGEAFLTA